MQRQGPLRGRLEADSLGVCQLIWECGRLPLYSSRHLIRLARARDRYENSVSLISSSRRRPLKLSMNPIASVCQARCNAIRPVLGTPGTDPKKMVGAAGFEPTTPCPPDKCATGLRYAPTGTPIRSSVFCGQEQNGLCRAKCGKSAFAGFPLREPNFARSAENIGSFKSFSLLETGFLTFSLTLGK